MNSTLPSDRSSWERFVDLLAEHPALTLGLAATVFCALGWWQDGINLDSTTYSVIARNLAEHGGWFDPTYTPYHHTHFAEHPPLVLWAQAVIFWLFGATDSTARIFGQLCTIGSVVAVYGLAKEAGGKGLGILAGLVLLLTYNYMQIGNSTLLDVPMSFFTLVALWGLARMQSIEVGAQLVTGPILVAGVALGCAFLTKGVVAGPVFLAVAVILFILRRDWLTQARFWLLPGAALAMIGVILLGDALLANGHFAHHYFLVQVWRRFLGGGPEIHTDWYEFVWRLFKMYLPFVLGLPIGIYLVIRRRMSILYPTLITLLAYVLFYSMAAKLYYHYFSPAYALAAPLVAVAVASFVREAVTRKVLAVFALLWVATAVGVTVAGVPIHEIRLKPIYQLSPEMNRLLEGRLSRDGLMVREREPHWDVVAKTSWYWRSDLLTVPSLGAAADSMSPGSCYNYVIVEPSDLLDSLQLDDLGLIRLDRKGDMIVLVRSDSAERR